MLGADGFHHAKPVHLGHLNIEKNQIGAHAPNGLDRRFAVAALANDADVRLRFQETEECSARQSFIVHDKGAQRHDRPCTAGTGVRFAEE